MLTKGAETLKGKDAQTFKSLAKFHDTKNFKKGLKTAEKLLQTNPEHPQTLALKALFQYNLGEQAKALQTARVALMKSKMKSLLCWHTYGTLLKNKRDYYQAAKSFQNALKMDPQNVQLLRQTANLYIQVRDHPNHVQARFSMLKLKPNVIHHWSSFVLAYHLKQDYAQLSKALNSLNNLVLGAGLKPQQLSQYHLYRILTLYDSGNYEGMYQQLLKFKQKILDNVLWKQDMVKCCEKLDKKEEATKYMQQLIKYFPENLQYLTKYSKMVDMGGRQFYRKMNTEFNSKIAKIMEISCIQQQNQFKEQLRKFFKPFYQKNLVSLYTEIQVVYNSPEKQKWIGQIFNQYYLSLKDGKYPDGSVMTLPTQYVWSLYLLSQHLSRNFETLPEAYQRIQQAIKHTNTVPQFYIVKAEIEYKMHNNCQAIKTINEARKVDLADRYMNNICIKYLLRCQKPNQAEEVLRLFMRQQSNLYQLQNQWFIIEAGKSFLKSRSFAPALRHFNFIEKQFGDMYANHYDFHTYCVRKWTLRQYVELIHFNDNLYKDKKYIEAASYYIQGLIQYWLSLKKKADEKAEQALQQKEQQGAKKKKNKKKKQATTEAKQQSPLQQYRKKLDYYGKQYIQKLTDPLKEAQTIATNVLSAIYVNKGNKKQNTFYFRAYGQCIQIFIHFNKPLLVLKALKRLKKTEGDKYDTHIFEIKALNYLANYLKEGTEQLCKQFIKSYLKDIDIDKFHKETVASWDNSLHTQLKTKQANLFSNKIWSLEESHNERSKLYRQQLAKLIEGEYNGQRNKLREVFYIVHKLEFLGEFSEQMKNKLQSKFGKDTRYFQNWQEEIDKLPLGTWSQWWLSDYDVKRQVLENEEKQQKGEQVKKQQTQQQKVQESKQA